MDKKRKVIAKGIPRNRYLMMLDDPKDKKRILTYSSKAMAEAAFRDVWFYMGRDVSEYLHEEYDFGGYYFDGKWVRGKAKQEDIMEAVEAQLTFEV